MYPDFFRGKINLAILLAPVATLHNCTGVGMKDAAGNENLIAMAKKIGPCLFPEPQVDNSIANAFAGLAGHGKFGLGLFTDSDPKLISATGLETFLGHFPAGASFQQIHHFSQEIVAQKF